MGRMAIAWIALAIVLCAGIAVVYGLWRWRDGTDKLHSRLLSARERISPSTYDSRELELLPAPVQRYFRAVLEEGQPIVAVARFAHIGTFNMGETSPKWRSFSSKQIVTTRPPGFDWSGRVRMISGVPIFVHDAYVAGGGLLHAELMGLITLADVRDTPEVGHGELLRYLAEAMWYPTALLPSQGVRWAPIDDASARATLTDRDMTVSLDFRFGPDGFIESSYTAARPRTLGGSIVSAPWTGRGWSYQLRGGMRIPIDAEVSWITPEGAYPYWRGRIVSIEYEFAP